MSYEPQMAALARGAIALHGELEEVIFLRNNNKDSLLVFADGTILPVEHERYGYDIRREKYAFPVAAKLGGTDPFSLLTFGYVGTGPKCYTVFLEEAGFGDANACDITAPLKLDCTGLQTAGRRCQARWTKELTGKTVEEARAQIGPPGQEGSCLLQEEILSDGTVTTQTVVVDTISLEEAEREAKRKLPAAADLLGLQTADKSTTITEKVLAIDEKEAVEKAKERIKRWESAWKTLEGAVCVRKARKGLFGIGRRMGTWDARYLVQQKEVTLRYVPQAMLKVHYGSEKMKCTQCGQTMATTTEGVTYVGASPTPETALLKLRCGKCDLTRVEKRWEIEGEWIAWEDSTVTVLPFV